MRFDVGGVGWVVGLFASLGCAQRDEVAMQQQAAQASDVSCGQVVTSSVKLRSDLTCTVSAVVIAADGVTVDLGGHTLTGIAQSDADPRWAGIKTYRGTALKNVRVMNGIVAGFDRGVDVRDASGVFIQNLTIRDPSSGYGIIAWNDTEVAIRNVVMTDVTIGISFVNSANIAVSDAHLTGPGTAPEVESMGIQLDRVSQAEIRSVDVRSFAFGAQWSCRTCPTPPEVPNSGSVKDSTFADTYIAVQVSRVGKPPEYLTNVVVAGNHITRAGTPDGSGGGIHAGGLGTTVRIVDNTVADSNRGIFIGGVTGSFIAGNTLLGNAHGGIELSLGSIGNKITSNTALGNGIDLWYDGSSSPNVWVDNICETTSGPDATCIPPEQPSGTVAVNFSVDDSANRVYGPGDLKWKGSFLLDDTTRVLTFDPFWSGAAPGAPPLSGWPTLYDDGPWTRGGHEPIGARAGDHVWGVTVFAVPPAAGSDSYEYGLIDVLYETTLGNGWIWKGLNGSFAIDADATEPITAPGATIERFGKVDVQFQIDTTQLIYPPWDTSSVTVKSSVWGWGELPMTAAGGGVYTLELSAFIGRDGVLPHTGLLAVGDVAEFVFVLGGLEYKGPVQGPDGNWYWVALPFGVSAGTERPGQHAFYPVPVDISPVTGNTFITVP